MINFFGSIDAEEFLVTAEEEEEEVDSVWARRDARDKIRAHQEKSTPKAQRQSSLTSFDSGRPTTDTGMIDAAAAVDALASLTKRLGLGLVEGGRAPNIEFFGQPTNDALESSALSFHAIATASMEHANHHTSFSPLFHFRFAVLNTTMCGENPLQASTDRRYNPSGSAIYRGGICISELASRTTNTEPILETVVGQDSDTLLTPAEIFHWGKNKRSSMKSFKLMKSSKMLKDGSQFESMSHPYKLIRHQEYDFSYFETVKGSRKQSYQSSFSQ